MPAARAGRASKGPGGRHALVSRAGCGFRIGPRVGCHGPRAGGRRGLHARAGRCRSAWRARWPRPPAARPRPHRRQGHGQHSGPDHGRGLQHPAPQGAGGGDGGRGHRALHHHHRRRGPIRSAGTAGGPLCDQRQQGRLRDAAVRTAAAVRDWHAGHTRRCAGDDGREPGPAEGQRDRRPHHRRVRRARGPGAGVRAAVSVRPGRAAAPAALRDSRDHRRPGPVPPAQPDAGRVRRQRVVPQHVRGATRHRWRRHERGLPAHVPSRHGECQRGAAGHGHARPGIPCAVRAQRGAHGAGVGCGGRLDRPGLGERHRDADAVQRHRQRHADHRSDHDRRGVLRVQRGAGRLRPERPTNGRVRCHRPLAGNRGRAVIRRRRRHQWHSGRDQRRHTSQRPRGVRGDGVTDNALAVARLCPTERAWAGGVRRRPRWCGQRYRGRGRRLSTAGRGGRRDAVAGGGFPGLGDEGGDCSTARTSPTRRSTGPARAARRVSESS